MGKKLGAEFIGTFWLVLGGCGSAVLLEDMYSLLDRFKGVLRRNRLKKMFFNAKGTKSMKKAKKDSQ